MPQSRRQLLRLAGLAPLVVLASGQARAQAPASSGACYDPAALSLDQQNRRASLGYVEASPDQTRRCGLCALFVAGRTGCGTCQLLEGGPVTALSVCNSFTPKS